MASYIGAIDQGTTSTRFILFSSSGEIVASDQIEHRQIYPKPGWVEHDCSEIWENTRKVIRSTLMKAGVKKGEVKAVGITNQRETTIAFNPKSGEVYHNASVWQDLRTSSIIAALKMKMDEETLTRKTGLRFSPYFSAGKMIWLIENVPSIAEHLGKGEVVFGTMDTYLTARLTGCSAIVTDVTNASRYMLMDIRKGEWDDKLLELTGIERELLPEIVSSSGCVYGYTDPDGPVGASVPVAGILGDQQAALLGQRRERLGLELCAAGQLP